MSEPVRRRFSTRDLGLSIRMAVALAGSVAFGAAIEGDWETSVSGVIFLFAIPLLLWTQYTRSAGAALTALRARPEPAGDALVPVAERLAADAERARGRDPRAADRRRDDGAPAAARRAGGGGCAGARGGSPRQPRRHRH